MDWISDLITDICEFSDRSSPEDYPDHMLVTGKELRDLIARRFELNKLAVVETLGEPMDPRFLPTSRDLIALREDAAAMRGAGLPVTVNVAPRVLYLAWPNGQYDHGNPDSSRWRCISFNLPE